MIDGAPLAQRASPATDAAVQKLPRELSVRMLSPCVLKVASVAAEL